MSRKHNVKHTRSPSRYRDRLAARGLSRAPLMKRLSALCKDHEHRNHHGETS